MFPRQLNICFNLRFDIEFLKMAASGDLHFNVARQGTTVVQYSSGDSNSLVDRQKVIRRMLLGNPRSSPEFPGKLLSQICTQCQLWIVKYKEQPRKCTLKLILMVNSSQKCNKSLFCLSKNWKKSQLIIFLIKKVTFHYFFLLKSLEKYIFCKQILMI